MLAQTNLQNIEQKYGFKNCDKDYNVNLCNGIISVNVNEDDSHPKSSIALVSSDIKHEDELSVDQGIFIKEELDLHTGLDFNKNLPTEDMLDKYITVKEECQLDNIKQEFKHDIQLLPLIENDVDKTKIDLRENCDHVSGQESYTNVEQALPGNETYRFKNVLLEMEIKRNCAIKQKNILRQNGGSNGGNRSEVIIYEMNMGEVLSETCRNKLSNILGEKVALEKPAHRNNDIDDILSKNEYCKECEEEFQIYCSKCFMLSHILNNNVPYETDNRAFKTLPRNILTVGNSSSGLGVFALKTIPKGIIFGPLEGLEAGTTRSTWKLKGGRFLVSPENSKQLNWMQFIKRSKNHSDQNLTVFQSKGSLYYRTECIINSGEQLLVYFGKDHAKRMHYAIDTYLSPIVEKDIAKIYACTYCCIGFKSRVYLIKHKAVCPRAIGKDILCLEIVSCYYCRIYLDKEEYTVDHKIYCRRMYERRCQTHLIPEQNCELKRYTPATTFNTVKRKKCDVSAK